MISIIAAIDRNLGIGFQNKLLFWLFKILHNIVYRLINTLFGHVKKACFKRTINSMILATKSYISFSYRRICY